MTFREARTPALTAWALSPAQSIALVQLPCRARLCWIASNYRRDSRASEITRRIALCRQGCSQIGVCVCVCRVTQITGPGRGPEGSRCNDCGTSLRRNAPRPSALAEHVPRQQRAARARPVRSDAARPKLCREGNECGARPSRSAEQQSAPRLAAGRPGGPLLNWIATHPPLGFCGRFKPLGGGYVGEGDLILDRGADPSKPDNHIHRGTGGGK